MAKKYFKVTGYCTTYAYLYVKADDEQQAHEIARDTDGGEFIPDTEPMAGEWTVGTPERITKTEFDKLTKK